MAGLKDIKKRLKTVNSTQKLTSAMKLLAASKLSHLTSSLALVHQYYNAFLASAQWAYAHMSADELEKYQQSVPSFFLRATSDKPHIFLILGANKGLCGNYNLMAIRTALTESRKYEPDQCKFMPITIKAAEYFQKYKPTQTEALSGLGHFESQSNFMGLARYILENLEHRFEHGDIGSVSLICGHFVNALIQKVEPKPLFPLMPSLSLFAPSEEAQPKSPIIEPDPAGFLAATLKQMALLRIYMALLESETCEQAARVTMMESAKRNAEELIDGLTLQYNRTRQANITNELIEIIAGRSAMVSED